MKRRQWRVFFRTLLITATAVVLPLLLFGGIAVADKNTRETGFSGRDPVFCIRREADGGVTFSAFGDEISVDARLVRAADRVQTILKTAAPHAAKAGAALIERLVDRILPLVFPAH